MKRFICALALCFIASFNGWSWGRIAHETIAMIAENHLTPKARKQVEKYLGGQSVVYYAKYMDEIRKTPDYLFTDGWHTAKVDSNFNYVPSKKKKGDAVYAVHYALDNLQDYKHMTDSAVAFNIKVLLHFVGDMHCPAHIKYPWTQGFNVYIEDNYHRFPEYSNHLLWDNAVIQYHREWSETEWAGFLDRRTKQEYKEIVAGTPEDWLSESARFCNSQFEWVKPEAKLGQDFINYALDLSEEQILKAGFRLAAVLNSIFK